MPPCIAVTWTASTVLWSAWTTPHCWECPWRCSSSMPAASWQSHMRWVRERRGRGPASEFTVFKGHQRKGCLTGRNAGCLMAVPQGEEGRLDLPFFYSLRKHCRRCGAVFCVAGMNAGEGLVHGLGNPADAQNGRPIFPAARRSRTAAC